jgi:hypothetical protein
MHARNRSLVISAPHPRSLDLIFSPQARAEFHRRYDVLEAEPEDVRALAPELLARARYIVGQPALDLETVHRMAQLR